MSPLARAGRQFIDGAWVRSSASRLVAVENPASGAVLAEVCEGSAEDAGAAVRSAREAWPLWSSASVSGRTAILRETARLLRGRVDELTELISDEVGTPTEVARAAQVLRPIEVLEALCDAAEAVEWTAEVGNTLVVREPVGVVVAITPWNFPLHQVIAKVGAALAAGCTVVLKPSELAPLSSYLLADSLAEAGLPAGVLNVVTGRGSVVGDALTSHPEVDAVSFTGSTAVGRHIGAVAAATVKRVALELGGKGPSVVLPGADVAAAAAATAARCFTNSGQVCAALTRLIVPRGEVEVAEAALAEFVGKQLVGDPRAEGVTMGPLVSADQKERVTGLMRTAVAEGARVLLGGPDAPVPVGGHFVAPTVLCGVEPGSTAATVEFFGPVLSVMAHDGVDDAVRIANEGEYGLVGAVWGPDDLAAARVAARLRVGMVGVNGGRINVRAPFGGYKQSGNGREFGTYGIEEFLEVKSVNFVDAGAIRWPEEGGSTA